MDVDPNSLERIVPDQIDPSDTTGRAALELHLERYNFAAQHVRHGRLLDIACGVGYGTRLVADRASARPVALGVDISPQAIAHARAHYARPGVEFQVDNADEFEDRERFDTIISLETIEHLSAVPSFIDRLARLLRPGGIVVASVPVTPSVDLNPHHLHDFTERSFRKLFINRGFQEVASLRQVQGVSLFAILSRRERRMKDMRPNLPGYYFKNPRALLRRVWTSLRYGFSNAYITIAWRSPVRRDSACEPEPGRNSLGGV
jgi:cyclopropane fatty-acyl-phospholipid synthase-like methyltransferase